jgi:hypothetical protein
MRRSTLIPYLLTGLVLSLGGCGAAGSSVRHVKGPDSAVALLAPPDIVTLAQRSARAAVADVRLPAGAVALGGSSGFASHSSLAAGGAFGDDQAYLSLVEWHASWRVARAAATLMGAIAADIAPAARASGTSSSGSVSSQTWALPRSNAWFSRRDLYVSVSPVSAGASIVTIAARVVWVPERLRIPPTARSVTLTLAPSGRVLARLHKPGELRAIIAAVDTLSPDEAVLAVYSCPALVGPQAPTELRLTFADARGVSVAVLLTEFCPPDARLTVPGYGSLQLTAGSGFIIRLEAITDMSLPSIDD